MRRRRSGVQVFGSLVAGEDEALVLGGVLVPELCGLAVERARAVMLSVHHYWRRYRHVFDSLVRLAQQALQTQQDSGDVVDGAPLVLEDIETDAAGEVDVGVVDRGLVEDGRRHVGVVVGEVHGQLEDEVGVGSVGRAVDSGSPDSHVLVIGECGDTRGRLGHDVHKLLLQTERALVAGPWILSRRDTDRAAMLAFAPLILSISELKTRLLV